MELLGQSAEIAESVAKVTQGRSETFVILLIMAALMAFKEWRDWKTSNERERHEREVAIRNSEALKTISNSNVKISKGIELISGSMDSMETRQDRDRRALLNVVDSLEAKMNGDDMRSERCLRDARSILVSE